jgi:hypothetical protein
MLLGDLACVAAGGSGLTEMRFSHLPAMRETMRETTQGEACAVRYLMFLNWPVML